MKSTYGSVLTIILGATLIGLGAGLLPGCAPASDLPPPDGNPRFDWFEYEGMDAVYVDSVAGPDSYTNPILAGFYPDPSMIRVDDDYFLVNSSFAMWPGIPIFHSRDLVSWTQIGHVIDRPSQLRFDSLRTSRGVFAPTIRYHDGVFYIINTAVDSGGNFIVTAERPEGPWSDPMWLSFDGIDPDLFFDEDGRVYIANNGPPDRRPLYNGHRAIWLQELDVQSMEMTGPRRVIVDGGVDISTQPVWIEAPHLYRIDGRYYLMAAEGGTGSNHSEVVFRSDDVWGPYVPYDRNPILTQRHLDPSRTQPITSTGHADFVELPNGNWWAVFLGTRPYEDDSYNTGRETFLLPVHWIDGWPVILEGDERVPFINRRPDLTAQTPPSVPMSGNFTIREDFNGPSLPLYWNSIRLPMDGQYSLSDPGGWLTLYASDIPLGSPARPSFLGRRQQHIQARASASMVYRPEHAGDRAGLVAFQNDNFFYFFGVVREGDSTFVQLQRSAGRRNGATAEVVASEPVALADDGRLYLRIEADADAYSFAYGMESDRWTSLIQNADGKLLSTRVAGGFVGTYFGVFAYTSGAPAQR